MGGFTRGEVTWCTNKFGVLCVKFLLPLDLKALQTAARHCDGLLMRAQGLAKEPNGSLFLASRMPRGRAPETTPLPEDVEISVLDKMRARAQAASSGPTTASWRSSSPPWRASR